MCYCGSHTSTTIIRTLTIDKKKEYFENADLEIYDEWRLTGEGNNNSRGKQPTLHPAAEVQ